MLGRHEAAGLGFLEVRSGSFFRPGEGSGRDPPKGGPGYPGEPKKNRAQKIFHPLKKIIRLSAGPKRTRGYPPGGVIDLKKESG